MPMECPWTTINNGMTMGSPHDAHGIPFEYPWHAHRKKVPMDCPRVPYGWPMGLAHE